jgi:hypothetical protein
VNGSRTKALRRSFREEFHRAPAPTLWLTVPVVKRRSRALAWIAAFFRRLFRRKPRKVTLTSRSEWRLLKSCYRQAKRKETS